MRMASMDRDGWQLENAEALAAAHPGGFALPGRDLRQSLPPGALAKLVFQIGFVDDDGDSFIHYQQLWIAIAERDGSGYHGALIEEPFLFAHEDEALRFGAPVRFGPGHVVDLILPADLGQDESVLAELAVARAYPGRAPQARHRH